MNPRLTYLTCHDNARHMLEYDTVSGTHTLLKRARDTPCEAFSTGSYILEDSDFLALVPTAHGPILLINERSYQLPQSQIMIELGNAPEGEINTFKVFSNTEEVFSIEYERPYSDLDYMIDEVVADFFYWLHDGYNDPEFIEYHTLKTRATFDSQEKNSEMPAMPLAEASDLKRWELEPLNWSWSEKLELWFDIAKTPSMWVGFIIIILLWCLETPFRAIISIAIFSFLIFQLWLWGAT